MILSSTNIPSVIRFELRRPLPNLAKTCTGYRMLRERSNIISLTDGEGVLGPRVIIEWYGGGGVKWLVISLKILEIYVKKCKKKTHRSMLKHKTWIMIKSDNWGGGGGFDPKVIIEWYRGRRGGQRRAKTEWYDIWMLSK